jgi:3-oxoacyl-[acyl-carrier-protein] synthase II
MSRNVWITGIGLITPLGIGWQENWRALCEGKSGIHAIRSYDATGQKTRIAGEVPEVFDSVFNTVCRIPFPERYARFTRFALLASHQAIEDAGLNLKAEDPFRIGISFGVGGGSFNYLLPINDALIKKGGNLESAMDHHYVIKCMTNAAAAQTSIRFGICGPSITVGTACASGAQAIGVGIDWIRSGQTDVVLAGGTDSTVNRLVLHAYNQVNALSTSNDVPEKASRPFDRKRDGFIMSEGAAILILEEEERAKRRGATCYATLLGYASTSEAYNIVAPRTGGKGMIPTMRLALANAGVQPEDIDYISAHGTSTPLNDANETVAIKEVFGPRAYQIPISSQKSMIGHAIGATSAIEAAVTALTIRHGVITPTINYEDPDPECDLDYVPNRARDVPIRYAISNAFGFGGHNNCLVFGRSR